MSSDDNSSAGRLTARLYRHRVIFALVLAAILATLGFLGRKVGTDNSLEIWFLDDDPALVAYLDYKKVFGNDEAIIVAATDPKSTFAPAALDRIRTASQKLAAHPKVKRVISVASGRHVDGDAVEIRTEPLLDPGPVTEESARRVQQRLDANPTLRGALVGKDPRMSLIVVSLRNIEDLDRERSAILADIRAIATAELARDGGGFHLGGIGVIYEGLNEATLRDQGIFIGVLSLVVAVGLWVLFRRWIWVVVGLGVMTAGLVFARGLAGLVGRDMNAVTGMVPTLIMTVGLMDLVHIVATYDEESAAHPTLSRREIMLRSVGLVAIPCIWNTFTDAAGFLSLATSHLQVIRDLGWSAAVGLILLLFTTFAVTIPVLARFGGGRTSAVLGAKARAEDPMARFTAGIARFAQRRRAAILVGAAAFTAISVVGIVGNSTLGLSGLVVDTYTLGFLPKDHAARVDHAAIEKGFGPYVPIEFEAVTTESGIKKPETLRAIEKAERTMEDHPEIGRVTGLPEIVSRVHQVVKDGDPAELRIPDSREAVAQELLLYESDPDSELDSLVDPEFTRTRVTARGAMPSARELSQTLRELEQRGNEALGGTAKLHASGYIPLYVRIVDHVTQTQIDSFATALLLVTVVLVILLRSFKLGVAALVPNLVPVLMVLGFMGFVGIRLDIATVLIAAIAIGISVNDTTHVMFRFRHELRETPGDPSGAIERMLRTTGRAVVASSVLLLAGFSVLLFASVSSVRYFGLLIGLTLVLALICDLLITPALLSVLHRSRRDDMKDPR